MGIQGGGIQGQSLGTGAYLQQSGVATIKRAERTFLLISLLKNIQIRNPPGISWRYKVVTQVLTESVESHSFICFQYMQMTL